MSANNNTDLRSDLAKAKGNGSANNGVHHWKLQRITAIALIPLALWFIFTLNSLLDAGEGIARTFFESTFNACMMLLFLLFGFYHAALGLQVVIEDYIHKKPVKYAALIIVKLGAVALCIYSVFSLLKLHIG